MNIKSGSILICRGHSIISKTIMKATKSKWSHAALYLEIAGVSYIVEAQAKGVDLKTYDSWKVDWGYEFITWTPDILNEDLIKRRSLSKVGNTAYDFQSFLLRQPFKLVTGKWRNKGNKEDDRMICSELVAWIYNFPGWESMTPDDLNKYLETQSNWKIN